MIEKATLIQVNNSLNANSLFDRFPSGFRQNYSTETALIKVFNDIYLNTDSGKTSILVLLHLTSSFILWMTKSFWTHWKTVWGYQVHLSVGSNHILKAEALLLTK